MKVSVVCPLHNGARLVPDLVKDLSRQCYQDIHVYFVDDASQDDTVEQLHNSATHLPHTIIRLEKNLGPAAARNVAIRRAKKEGAELILLIDSDCRVRPDWVERHVAFLRQRPDVSIVGGAILGKSKKIIGRADGYCSWFTAPPHSKSGPMNRFHLSTTNMSIRSEVFDKVGFFDEELKTGEDVAFCRRVRKAGLLLWLQPDIVMEHLDRNTYKAAALHHYRWGLHSYRLCLMDQGGYYSVLKTLPKWLVPLTIPVFCLLNVVLIVGIYAPKQARVLLYLPWIIYLKWHNSRGVYAGFLDSTLCLRKSS